MNQCPYRDNVMCSHYIRCKKESVPDCEYYYKDMPITGVGKTITELESYPVVNMNTEPSWHHRNNILGRVK